MPTTGQRNSRAALDAARASFDALTSDAGGGLAQRYLVAWSGLEDALKALAGTTALDGLALVRELRQRTLLTLDEAHAFVDFHAAAERARSDDYVPTAADLEVAKRSYDRLLAATEREATTGDASGGAYSGTISSPTQAAGAPEASYSPVEVTPARHSNMLGGALLAVLLVAIVGSGAFYLLRGRGSNSGDLATGRKAYASGDRTTARAAFATAAGAQPTLAEPHIYLGRMAREEGNFAEAGQQLRRAVELEPQNALAMRELAGYLLATGQLELARSFYERAIRLDPQDKVALGFMGCTLHRLGRPDLAQRFVARAGAGSWDQCLRTPVPPPMSPPTGVPIPR